MDLYKQLVSLDLAKRLCELGVKQESLFYWVNLDANWTLTFINTEEDRFNFDHAKSGILPLEHYSAFTVAELGEMLANSYSGCFMGFIEDGHPTGFSLYNYLSDLDMEDPLTKSKKEADARAEMLIYLLENKFLKECST